MTADELLAEVRRQFAAAADPEFAKNLRRFSRESVDPWGVRSAQALKIEQFAYREIKHWPLAQRNRFCTELMKGGKLEEGAACAHIYRRFKKTCGADEFKLFERWIDRYVENWAHTDGIAGWLLAACIENDPSLSKHLPRWTESTNRWKRRAAAVAFLQEAKQGRHTAEIFHIADLLRDDTDDMVQKGVGWVLKESYVPRPREVVAYLRTRTFPRLVLRYAGEKMSARDRLQIGLRR